jgi:hypothetical protein
VKWNHILHRRQNVFAINDPSVITMFQTVSTYNIGVVTENRAPIRAHVLPATQTVINLNPFYSSVRTDGRASAPICGNSKLGRPFKLTVYQQPGGTGAPE